MILDSADIPTRKLLVKGLSYCIKQDSNEDLNLTYNQVLKYLYVMDSRIPNSSNSEYIQNRIYIYVVKTSIEDEYRSCTKETKGAILRKLNEISNIKLFTTLN